MAFFKRFKFARDRYKYYTRTNKIPLMTTADLIIIICALIVLFFLSLNKIKKNKLAETQTKAELSGIVALWDTTTIDIPDASIIRDKMCKELYFTSGIHNRPCIETIKTITGVHNAVEYNFKTNIQTSIQLNLLFALAEIEQNHKNNCELHIFTKCPQLRERLIYQANANKITKLYFYGVEEH